MKTNMELWVHGVSKDDFDRLACDHPTGKYEEAGGSIWSKWFELAIPEMNLEITWFLEEYENKNKEGRYGNERM